MSNNAMRESNPEDKESTPSTPASSVYMRNPNSQNEQVSVQENGPEKEEIAADGPTEVEYASGFRLAAIVAALALSVFLVSLDLTIVATAIPKITDVSFPPVINKDRWH